MRYEPASTIIDKFGGTRVVAEIAEVSVHTVIRWRLAREKGGTGGVIPHWHVSKLIRAARDRNLSLSASDFVLMEGVAA